MEFIYTQLPNWGSIIEMIPKNKTDVERFHNKYTKENNCWIWKAGTRKGYGMFWINGRNLGAHVFSYELFNGPIPNGLVIDHLCKNKLCVNPFHLDVTTRFDNVLRGINQIARNKQKTHCKLGHVYSGENLYIKPNGERDCKTCNIIRNKIWREKKRG